MRVAIRAFLVWFLWGLGFKWHTIQAQLKQVVLEL